MFTPDVPDYNNTTSADFTSVLTYGDNTILANYSEGDNTNGVFSVGKRNSQHCLGSSNTHRLWNSVW